MAETLAEKLKRLAREKAEAKAKAESSTVAEVTEVANVQPVEGNEEKQSESGTGRTATVDPKQSIEKAGGLVQTDAAETGGGDSGSGDISNKVESIVSGTGTAATLQDVLTPTPAGPTHPLAMQFMELEQALDSTDASFKVKLRDIHRHLGKDPDLVTQMTEAEIALVVKGLVIFANAEIVEPAKAKTVKAATAAAKKKVISADDL